MLGKASDAMHPLAQEKHVLSTRGPGVHLVHQGASCTDPGLAMENSIYY